MPPGASVWSFLPWTRESYIKKFLSVTPEERDELAKAEQRTPIWFKAREGRASASRFGGLVGLGYGYDRNGRQRDSMDATAKEFIHGLFKGNIACRYGTFCEPICAEVMERSLGPRIRAEEGVVGVRFTYPGFLCNVAEPWVGVSPDGIIEVDHADGTVERRLIEIKCPYSKRHYPTIPSQYWCQIQGIMGLEAIDRCYFVVMTPTEVHFEEYNYDREFFEGFLMPTMRTFYMETLLPLLALKRMGLLKKGQTKLVPVVRAPEGAAPQGAPERAPEEARAKPTAHAPTAGKRATVSSLFR